MNLRRTLTTAYASRPTTTCVDCGRTVHRDDAVRVLRHALTTNDAGTIAALSRKRGTTITPTQPDNPSGYFHVETEEDACPGCARTGFVQCLEDAVRRLNPEKETRRKP